MGGAVMSPRKKKILIIVSSVVAALLVLTLSLWIYYRNAEFGFAREVSNRVLFLADGIIAEEGPPEEIFGNPQCERLQSFLAKVL